LEELYRLLQHHHDALIVSDVVGSEGTAQLISASLNGA
jgi:hypothetical protein